MRGGLVSFITLFAPTATASSVGISSAQPSESATERPFSDPLCSGFSQTCNPWGGLYGSDYAILNATCSEVSGGTNTTSINLNDCIANAGTSLACETNGYFLAGCTLTSGPSNGSTILSAICDSETLSFDIDTCVGNVNGVLKCSC